MPIHDVGYRRWEGQLESPWLRWVVIASAGIRLVWKNHWARRMLFFSWLPAAALGIAFFAYEQALEQTEAPGRLQPPVVQDNRLVPPGEFDATGSTTPHAARGDPGNLDSQVCALQTKIRDLKAQGLLQSDADPMERLETVKQLEAQLRLLKVQEIGRRGERAARRQVFPRVLRRFVPHSEAAADAWLKDPSGSRHAVWSLLLMTFFRYPQGTLMVMLVGMIAPSLVSLDFRSRAFLLYFSRPITPFEYVFGKAMVLWCYLAAITTLPALVLYLLGVLLSPDINVILYTWDLPFRILAASLVLMIPTTSLALFLSSMTSESRYAGFSWFAVWGLGWAAYANLEAVSAGKQWSMISLYHVLGRVQAWVFGLSTDVNDVTSAATMLVVVTVLPFIVLMCRVAAPMRI